MRYFLLILTTLFITSLSQAKPFSNAYVSFELPPNWDCTLENTEWICTSLDKKASREAIIILTAKEAGNTDSLSQYEMHLKTPRNVKTRKGQTVQSKVIHVKQKKLKGHTWVDGFHLSSEIPNYYTRYLATVKGGLAILVTFSAHKAHYSAYSNSFFQAINSLKIVANRKLIHGQRQQIKGAGEYIGPGVTPSLPDFDDTAGLPLEEDGTESDDLTKYLILAILVIAVGGYIYLKST